jgi:hypothetical protein
MFSTLSPNNLEVLCGAMVATIGLRGGKPQVGTF